MSSRHECRYLASVTVHAHEVDMVFGGVNKKRRQAEPTLL
jgi:hypothetical protein